jgi:hypothetical protein
MDAGRVAALDQPLYLDLSLPPYIHESPLTSPLAVPACSAACAPTPFVFGLHGG